MRRALVAVLLVASVLVPAPAQAAEETVDLDYTVELLDADEGTYRIEARFSGLEDGDVISKFTFYADRYARQFDDCSNVTVDGASHDCSEPIEVDVSGNTLTYSFEANLDVRSGNGGYNSRTEPTWAVLQASGVGFAFSYSHPSTTTPVFEPTMTFDLPDGWKADASFPRDGDTFRLEPQFPRPAGVIVLGEFERTRFEVLGRDAVLAEVEPAEADIPHLINATAPYLRSTHGDVVGPKVLFVAAPGPFKEGGVATRDGFAVSLDAPEETVVHEWVHLFQRFEVCNLRPGRDCDPRGDHTDESGASIWIKEGGAEYYSALALYAGGEWTVSRTQQFFDDVRDRYDEAPLDEAVYGSADEDAAYTKGALAVARADRRLRDASGGTIDLGTVVRDLNDEIGAEMNEPSPGDITETNDDFARRLEDRSGESWDSYFDAYVRGSEDPGDHTFDPTGTFDFDDLIVTPNPVVAGGPMRIAVNVTNTGTQTDEDTFRFFVDGRAVHDATVSLEPGASTRIRANTTAPDPGTARVEVATLRRQVAVRAPADLRLADIAPDPARPQADTPYAVTVTVANDGGVPGTGNVSATVGNTSLGAETVTVREGEQATVRFPGATSPAGNATAVAELTFDGETSSATETWTVQSPPPLDIEEIRKVPGPGVAAAVAALALAWARRKR